MSLLSILCTCSLVFCQFDQLLLAMTLWQYSLPASATAAQAKQLDPWVAQHMYQNALHSAWEPNTI